MNPGFHAVDLFRVKNPLLLIESLPTSCERKPMQVVEQMSGGPIAPSNLSFDRQKLPFAAQNSL